MGYNITCTFITTGVYKSMKYYPLNILTFLVVVCLVTLYNNHELLLFEQAPCVIKL